MATTKFGIAKTQRELTLQKFLNHALGNVGDPQFSQPVVFRGRTTDATATEIFIQGKTGISGGDNTTKHRLALPEDSAIMFRVDAIAWNVTDGKVQYASSFEGGIENDGGTTQAIDDYDSGLAGTQEVLASTVFAHAEDSTVVTVALDNTNDAITVTVTGVAAKTIDWVVALRPLAYIAATSDMFYGDSAAGDGY